MAWPVLQKTLTAQGTYGVYDGRIHDTPITQAVAKLLNMQEFNDLAFEKIDGSLTLNQGKVSLKSQMSGGEMRFTTSGTVGLDGSMDLPVTLILSKAMSDRLQERASVAKYLVSDKGETSLNLTLGGTFTHPRPGIDTSAVTKQVQEVVKKKAAEEIGKLLSKDKEEKNGDTEEKPDAARELIKGIFGR